jgi:hypothetical protein
MFEDRNRLAVSAATASKMKPGAKLLNDIFPFFGAILIDWRV